MHLGCGIRLQHGTNFNLNNKQNATRLNHHRIRDGNNIRIWIHHNKKRQMKKKTTVLDIIYTIIAFIPIFILGYMLGLKLL
jgi:hypothetical protein